MERSLEARTVRKAMIRLIPLLLCAYLTSYINPVILAFVVLFFLPDRPKDSKWLTPEERDWLQGRIDAENRQIESNHSAMSLFKALTDGRTLALSYIYFANTTSSLGIAFFLPTIIKSLGSSNSASNYLASLPFIAGTAGILLFGEISDRFKTHRRLILVVALCITALGMAGAGLIGATYASIVLIGVSAVGTYGGKAPFWPLPSMFLTGSAAAGGIALINAVGNLGGFVGPYMIGWVKDTTGGYSGALYMLGALAFSGAVVTLLLKTPSHLEPAKATAEVVEAA